MDSSHNIDLKISEMPKVINLQICFQLQEPQTLNLQTPEPVNLQDTKPLNLQHSESLNLQESVKIDQLSVDECLQNSELSASTCVTYKRKINDMLNWVCFHDTFTSEKKQKQIIERINKIDGISNKKQYLCAMKVTLKQLKIKDMCGLDKELEKIIQETQNKTNIEAKTNLKPIDEAYRIMNWLNQKLEYYKELSTSDLSAKNRTFNNQIWCLLELYINYGVLRSNEIRIMKIIDDCYNDKTDFSEYTYNIYYKKSQMMVIPLHKTNHKSKGNNKFKVKKFA